MNTKGRCPVCDLFMRSFRTHFWRDMKLTLPYDIYRCPKHGIYVWNQDKHELADFEFIKKDAEISKIPEAEKIQWFDPTIIEMRCPICGEKWKQHGEFPSAISKGVVFCPNNHSIKKEEAIKY